MPCWRNISRNAEWLEEEHRGSRTAEIPQSRLHRPLEEKVMKNLRWNRLNADSIVHLPPMAGWRKRGGL